MVGGHCQYLVSNLPAPHSVDGEVGTLLESSSVMYITISIQPTCTHPAVHVMRDAILLLCPSLAHISVGFLMGLLLHCHSNSSTAECRQRVRKMAALLTTVTQTCSS